MKPGKRPCGFGPKRKETVRCPKQSADIGITGLHGNPDGIPPTGCGTSWNKPNGGWKTRIITRCRRPHRYRRVISGHIAIHLTPICIILRHGHTAHGIRHRIITGTLMKEEDIGDKNQPLWQREAWRKTLWELWTFSLIKSSKFMYTYRNFNYIFSYHSAAFSLNIHSICFKINCYITMRYFGGKDDIHQDAQKNIYHMSFGI